MEWFDGSVTEALDKYQQKQGILVVYVYAENDENTNKFDGLWNSFDGKLIENVPYIAIRLANGSEGANQFSQFFPTLTIPVCYILGMNAQPLEVITALQELDQQQLSRSFSKAISLYEDQLKEQGISTGAQKMEIAENTKKNEASGEGEDQGVKTPEMTEDAEVGANTEMSKEDKLEHYRKLLEEKKKADAEKQKEEERQKEIQRRNDGKAMAESREKQRERELRESAEARRREKMEDQAALKRLREQLKADKEQRAKRNKDETFEPTKEPKKEVTTFSETINKPVNTDQCRVQCRFPDATTLNLAFPSKEPLQVVYEAVSKDPRKPSNFALFQPYPRKKLTELDKSLLDHGLTPSSVILVISDRSGANNGQPQQGSLVSAGGYLQMLFGFIYHPFVALYQYFLSFTNGPTRNNNETSRMNPNKQEQQSGSKSGNKKPDDGKEATIKDGNIRRFNDQESDHSDTDATWNGNSTQQL